MNAEDGGKQGERPSWQIEAEQLGEQTRAAILREIKGSYSGSLPFYIHDKFGADALRAILAIAEENFQRTPQGDFDSFSDEALLRYALNRTAFQIITDQRGYRAVDREIEALGNESIAVLTRSGSMVFGSPGSLTTEGEIGYLPIAGREMRPTYGTGLLIPVQLIEAPDAKGTIAIPNAGHIPVAGNILVIRNVEGIESTSPVVEVKMKYGDQARDTIPMRSMITSMRQLNKGLQTPQ